MTIHKQQFNGEHTVEIITIRFSKNIKAYRCEILEAFWTGIDLVGKHSESEMQPKHLIVLYRVTSKPLNIDSSRG